MERKIPIWMNRVLPKLGITNLSEFEELINDDSHIEINAPRAIMAIEAKATFDTLMKLKTKRLLNVP